MSGVSVETFGIDLIIYLYVGSFGYVLLQSKR